MRTRVYVGLRADGKGREVFRSATTPVAEPHPDTHLGPIYSAVIGPFRTRRGAEFMAKFGANNPHCQTVADAERLAAQYVPTVSEQTVYVASAWWHDCDPFVSVCGNSPRAVEKAIMRSMRDAAIDVYNQSGPEDKRKVRDYLDDIGWSGVNAFQFDAIIPQHTIDRYEPGFSGGEQHVTHDSEMDYFDYEALRRGDKTAIVYLSTY
jgi:hypothetical protein